MSLYGTSSAVTFEPLSASQRAGTIVVAVFALSSALALAFIALRTIRLSTVVFLQCDKSSSRPTEILFFRTQIGHYFGHLVFSNLCISAAGLIDFGWVLNSGLSEGPSCSVQAILKQIGIWSTSWFTAAIGVHILNSFVFHIRPSLWRSLAVAVVGWMIAVAAGLTPLLKSSSYGPTGLSCGITQSYPTVMFILGILPIILGGFVSIVVYPVIFLALHGKLNMSSMRRARGPSSSQQGEDRSEEYHGFITTIIRTMFCFPLAFVFLFLPFCVTHILVYAGYMVPFAPSVFADVCVSMLGLVNVCLLYNTFGAISSAYRGPRPHTDKEMMMTSGNDVSNELQIVPQDQSFLPPMIPPHINSHQMYGHTQGLSNHLRVSSWDSVDSNTGLLAAEEAPYTSIQARMVPLALSSTASPSGFSRQFGGDAPLSSTAPGVRSAHVPYVTRDTRLAFASWDPRPLQLVAVASAPRKGTKEPTFKPKTSPTLDLPSFLDLPYSSSTREVANKSSTHPARLSVPAVSPAIASIRKPHQGNAKVFVSPIALVPCIVTNTLSRETVAGSNSLPSLTPSSSFYTDSDSAYSEEISHVPRVRPLSGVPESNDGEDFLEVCSLSPRCVRARSQRTTMTTVWSQETGYTLSIPEDAEALEAFHI